jgi:hypothetical protein
MWAVCGALTYMAWNRIEEREGSENVGKVCPAPRVCSRVMLIVCHSF